eukprot:m.57416 g.57416  ORF g.57416 m.57416 type:complete len:63 (-) comp7073_c1_seq1:1318-1506(-)
MRSSEKTRQKKKKEDVDIGAQRARIRGVMFKEKKASRLSGVDDVVNLEQATDRLRCEREGAL